MICFYYPGHCTETSAGVCMCGSCVHLSSLDGNFTLIFINQVEVETIQIKYFIINTDE